MIDGYRVKHIRAVATSAVREARNGEHVPGSDPQANRHRLRDHQRGRGEPARVPGGPANARAQRGASGAWTLLAEVGGGSTSLTLLRRRTAQSVRRLRAGRGAAAPAAEPATADATTFNSACSSDRSRTSSTRFGWRSRSRRVTQMVVIGGDVRFAASQILESDAGDGIREIPRERSSRSAIGRAAGRGAAGRSVPPAGSRGGNAGAGLARLPSAAVGDCGPPRSSSPTRRCGRACSWTSPSPGGRLGAADFEHQVLASAEAVGQRYRFDRAHGRPRRDARDEAVRRVSGGARPRRIASGCCCRSPRCCTTSAFT